MNENNNICIHLLIKLSKQHMAATVGLCPSTGLCRREMKFFCVWRLFEGRPLRTDDVRYGVSRVERQMLLKKKYKNRALLSAVSQTTPFSRFSTQLTFSHSPVVLCIATQVSMGIKSGELELFPQFLKLRPVSSCHLKSSSYQTEKTRHQNLKNSNYFTYSLSLLI